ncbi:MAG TPA: IclR family transcriptional regulator [Mycobacteriales bacterium]|nr:IclR family transcriptional regulator [Mycobacteriales bacterium]
MSNTLDPAGGPEPAYPVSSADNVLRLLRLLHEDGRLRVADAADRLGVARSTAHRLLVTLRHHGFASQDGRRVYRPGPALAGLGAGRANPDLRTVAHRHLQALARRTGETVHLMALEGNGVRFLDGVDGTYALRVGTRIGLLMAAHTTSGGKALLAELPGEDLRRLYPRGLPRADPPAIGDLTQLRRALVAVRRRGYATNVEESEPGISAVGVCVRDGTGQAVAAVAMAAPTTRCPRRRWPDLAPELQLAAVAIGAEL